MVRDEPIQMCPSCPHPQSGHLKSSGACFIQDCMCGWEMKNGQKNPSHPMYDGRSFQPKPEVAFWKKPHVIPSPAPAIIRPPSKKQHERLFERADARERALGRGGDAVVDVTDAIDLRH